MSQVEKLFRTIQNQRATAETFLALSVLLNERPDEVLDAFNRRSDDEGYTLLGAFRERPDLATVVVEQIAARADRVTSPNLRAFLCAVLADMARTQAKKWQLPSGELENSPSGVGDAIIEWYKARQEYAELVERHSEHAATLAAIRELRKQRAAFLEELEILQSDKVESLHQEVDNLRRQLDESQRIARERTTQLEDDIRILKEKNPQLLQEMRSARQKYRKEWFAKFKRITEIIELIRSVPVTEAGETQEELALQRAEIIRKIGDAKNLQLELERIFARLDEIEPLLTIVFENQLRDLYNALVKALRNQGQINDGARVSH